MTGYGPDEWGDDDPDTWLTDHTGARIRNRLDELGARYVLEAGCASGRMTAILADTRLYAGRRVVAVDKSWAMIRKAQERLVGRPGVDRVEFTTADLNTITGPFDAIVCTLVLHEVAVPVHMLQRFSRLLAPGGVVFVTVPSANSLHHEGKPMKAERAERFGVRHLWAPRVWDEVLTHETGLTITARAELFLKPYPAARMACLSQSILDHLAEYQGPGGALAYYELGMVF